MMSQRLPWKHNHPAAVSLIFMLMSACHVLGQEFVSTTTTTVSPSSPTTTTMNVTCIEDMWMCTNGSQCIRSTYLCDGDNDCRDNSDEWIVMCGTYICDEDRQFECRSNREAGKSKVCIPRSYLCDSDDDCGDGSDELPQNCPTTTTVISTTKPPRCDVNLEFECPDLNDRGCIPIGLKCDTMYDCKNGEDEKDCVIQNCTQISEFRCNSGQCIDSVLRCNGRHDCRDGSDEAPSLCEKPPVTCKPSDFTCNNGKCFTWHEVLCNGKDDCGDNSDEDSCRLLNINECSDKTLNNCTQGCQEMTFGFKCTCKDGYKLDTDGKTCSDINECDDKPGSCMQLCSNTDGSYKCSCAAGYTQIDNTGQKCKHSTNIEPYLIFGNKYTIRRMNLNGSDYRSISSEHTYTHVIDYDYANKMIYYADAPNMKQTLKRMNFDGSSKEVIERHHVVGIEGVAVDWIGDNIYWTSNKQQGIFVSRKDGRYLKVLIHNSSKQPRAIGLHPKTGHLFWTDWSLEPFIARIGMDGTSMKKLIVDGIFWPNGLTIDYATDRLWWVDAHIDQLESADMNGENRHVMMTDLPHPYALSVFEENVYWTEWNLLKIERANRFTGANRTTIKHTIQMPYDIHVVHPMRQPYVKNPCGTNNGGCSHLCLLAPPTKPGDPVIYSCHCPDHFDLHSDGKNCTLNCSSGHFACKAPDEKCIPARFQCDGLNDCQEGDDEEGCKPPLCDRTYFQCGNTTQCIPNWRLCDRRNNCPGGADEKPELCEDYQCMSYEFRCASGQCIPLAWECDGDSDCQDGTDEQPHNIECTKCDDNDQFKCNNGKCIPLLWKCDWDDDCGDWSDEPKSQCYEMRRNTPCREGWTSCENNYRCIPTTNKCDGNDDCRDNSDESKDICPTCPRGDFQCNTGTPACIPARWKCDFRPDCADGSDENVTSCVYRKCSESEMRCTNQKCVRNDQKCDGIDNCQDGGVGSDERDCPNVSCSMYEFTCTTSSQCLSYDMVCDGIIHCDDASDETHCGTRLPTGEYCLKGQFACDNKACIPMAFVCDGENDCKDNSDESRDACAKINCTASQFACSTTHKCILSFLKCNGRDDCGDASDEKDCKATCYPQTQFTCPNGSCIPLRAVCDGVNDCNGLVGNTSQSSDEVGCVRSTYCTATSCQHQCVNITYTLEAYHKCECNVGYVHASYSSMECTELDECSSITLNTCPHNCTNTKGFYHCSCAEGFTDDGSDGFTCNAQSQTSMLYTVGYSLKKYTPRTQELNDVIMRQRNIGAITADIKNNIAYWIDRSLKKIYRAVIPTKHSDLGKKQDMGIPNIAVIEDIAYDWMGNNIFYIDSGNNAISVTKANWSYPRTLQRIRTTNTLKSLTVNSEAGLMFWSEFAAAGSVGSIRTANMSGAGRQYKILSAGLYRPASLTVDYYMNGRLYWVDRAKNTIESANYDGTDYRVIANVKHQPHSLDIFESSVFFTTREDRFINSIDKFGRSTNASDIHQANLAVNDIFIFSKHKYPMDQRKNRCAKMRCDGLCLPEVGGARCLCPDRWSTSSTRGCRKPYSFRELPSPALCTCHNGGTCVMSPLHSCVCAPHFTGLSCEIPLRFVPPTRPTGRTSTQTTTRPHMVVTASPPQAYSNQMTAAIVAPIIIAVIILGLVGLVIYWLRTRGNLGKTMSGHGEVRAGQATGLNGRTENGTPHDHITAEAAAYEHGTPVQREISFEDGAVRFSNPIYDTTQKKGITDNTMATTCLDTIPPSSEQDINTNYVYTPADMTAPDGRTEAPSIAEAVSGLAEVHLDLPTDRRA